MSIIFARSSPTAIWSRFSSMRISQRPLPQSDCGRESAPDQVTFQHLHATSKAKYRPCQKHGINSSVSCGCAEVVVHWECRVHQCTICQPPTRLCVCGLFVSLGQRVFYLIALSPKGSRARTFLFCG